MGVSTVTLASGRSDATGAYSTINYIDNGCVANIQGWSTPSCVNDTTGKIWTKLTIPGKMDWKKASDDIARTAVPFI